MAELPTPRLFLGNTRHAADLRDTARTPALVTLVDVLPTVAADPGVGGDRGTAARALQCLRGGLVVLVEVRELDHQVGGHDGQGQVDLHLRLPRGQLDLLGLVPARRPRKNGVGQTGRGPESLSQDPQQRQSDETDRRPSGRVLPRQ